MRCQKEMGVTVVGVQGLLHHSLISSVSVTDDHVFRMRYKYNYSEDVCDPTKGWKAGGTPQGVVKDRGGVIIPEW